MALDKLNEYDKFNLISDPDQYELFPARKNGIRDDGLPSLETNQNIAKTQIKRFLLAPLYKNEIFLNHMETK